MDSKSVLIIGGNGYIGSRLMYELSAEYDITSIDIGWYGLESNISIDYRDLTSTWLSKFEFVILLAGHSSVNMCNGELSASWQNNVNNFIDLIKSKILYIKMIHKNIQILPKINIDI